MEKKIDAFLKSCYPFVPKKWISYQMTRKKKYIAGSEEKIEEIVRNSILDQMKWLFLLAAIVFFLILGLLSSFFFSSSMVEVRRNDVGQGEETKKIELERGKKRYPHEITIPEKEYTKKEREVAFQKAFSEIERQMLGKNKSLRQVRSNLNLPWELSDSPIEVKWELEDENIIDLEGKVYHKNLKKGSKTTHLKLILTYRSYQKSKIYTVLIYPKQQSKIQKQEEKAWNKIKQIEKESRQEESFFLPKKIGNFKIHAGKQKNRWLVLLVLSMSAGVLLFAREMENEKIKEKKVKQAAELEYSKILWQFLLLLEAGFTIQMAWKKIVEDYKKQKSQVEEEHQYVYEQMAYAYHQMELGSSMEEVFKVFNERMGIKVYAKLMTLFLQNIKKGSKHMLDILKNEEQQAFLYRCEQAKRMGEEADTKLLLPMGIMLLDVLLLLMIPAYLQF